MHHYRSNTDSSPTSSPQESARSRRDLQQSNTSSTPTYRITSTSADASQPGHRLLPKDLQKHHNSSPAKTSKTRLHKVESLSSNRAGKHHGKNPRKHNGHYPQLPHRNT